MARRAGGKERKIYADPDGAKGREGGTVGLETGTIRGTSSVDRPLFAPSARGDYDARLFLGSHSLIRRLDEIDRPKVGLFRSRCESFKATA